MNKAIGTILTSLSLIQVSIHSATTNDAGLAGETTSKKVTTLLLIRHGETDWNVKNIMQGSSDIPLNEKGHKQAELLADKLLEHHPDLAKVVYSSNLQRAIDTAKKTQERFFQAGIEISHRAYPDLREISWGVYEGLPAEERNKAFKAHQITIDASSKTRKERWQIPSLPGDGVETFGNLLERTSKSLEEIALAHPGEKVAVFTHGRVINTLMVEALDAEDELSTPLPNCAVVHFTYNPENPGKALELVKVENLIK